MSTALATAAALALALAVLLLARWHHTRPARTRRDEQDGDAHLWDLRRARYTHPAHNWRATLVRPTRRSSRHPHTPWPQWDPLTPGWPLPRPHLPAAIYEALACPSVLGYDVRCERYTPGQPHDEHAVAVDFDHPVEPPLQLWHKAAPFDMAGAA